MKIAIISVAPPFRGGISKHTSILIEKLSATHSVDLINYSRQYPEFLFPGKSQYLEKIEIEPKKYWIDSINPISWIKTSNYLSNRNYDLIIFRFWNPFFTPALGTIAKIIKIKSKNTKMISLCDNIIPHEKILFSNILIKYFLKRLDGHLIQSNQTKEELVKILQRPIYEKCFHPVYVNYPKKINKDLAREKLNLKAKNIILYFGLIREYKGFDILLEAVSILKNSIKDFHLLVAGECYVDEKVYTKLINKLEIKEYITWHNRYIPDIDVNKYFSASDILALPYRSASQSGVAQLSYFYDCPVIVTDVGGLPEIVEEKKSGFIINVEDPDELASVLIKYLGTNQIDVMSNFIKEYKNKFSWKNFVGSIESLYTKI